MTLHRAEREAGDAGDLLVREVVEERQPQHASLVVGQLRERVGDDDALDGLVGLGVHVTRIDQLLRGIMGAPLTFERQLEGARNDEPSYMISVPPDAASLSASQLRLYAWFLSAPERRDRLADAARAALAAERRPGHVPRLAQFHGTRLDPRRLDVVRTYVLACSVRERGKGPCRTDMAVRLHYHMRTGETSEPAILHDIRDAKGQIVLPELPGR